MLKRKMILLAGLTAALMPLTLTAAPLQWVGDVSNDWGTNTAGNTNWNGNVLPSGVAPFADIVMIGSSGTYTSTLDLDQSFTLSSFSASGNFGFSEITVASASVASGKALTFIDGATISYQHIGTTGPSDASRNVRFAAPINIQGDLFINFTGGAGFSNTGARRFVFNGAPISGGSEANPASVVVDNDSNSSTAYVRFQNGNNWVGSFTLTRGYLVTDHDNSFGDAGNTAYIGTTGPASILFNKSTNSVVPNDMVLGATGNILFTVVSTDAHMEYAGELSGGAAARTLTLSAPGDHRMVFSGRQSLASRVDVGAGAEIITAGGNASGEIWENVANLRLNFSSTGTGTLATSAFLIRGDLHLNKNLEIYDISTISVDTRQRIGQVNDGATAFDAVFNGALIIREDDARIVHLTADAGGSATFNGDIYHAVTTGGSVQGFEKTGDGLVTLTGRVSGATGSSTSIGDILVSAGTLRVNTQQFYGDITANAGTTLGGTGTINGNVSVAGTLSPGASIESLQIAGNLVMAAGSDLEIELGGALFDTLHIDGDVDLSTISDALTLVLLSTPTEASYTFLTYTGVLSGIFDDISSVTTAGFTVDYSHNGEVRLVNATPIPLPGAAMMGSVLLSALGLARARRR